MQIEEIKKKWIALPKKRKRLYASASIFFFFSFLYIFFHAAPRDFPVGQVVTINIGESLQTITTALHEAHVIRSPFVFRTTVILLGGEKKVIAGDYMLDKREGSYDIAHRLVKGKFHLEAVKVTVLEGWNIYDIANYLQKNLLKFNKDQFLALAKNKEGHLFPDTYFVSPTIKPEALIKMMEDNFDNKVDALKNEILSSGHSREQIITMASILEEEAGTTESRKIVSGILWRRISIGMPLQVDSTFSYINGKGTHELSLVDLKIDSPYNTYKYKGLPAGPISNPGLNAIEAAIYPTKTKYVYFLSSRNGTMHYAVTFDEHKKNKELYLNK
ncbi:MAG: endolytic transglycosylase MltG [Nitrospira sp.]